MRFVVEGNVLVRCLPDARSRSIIVPDEVKFIANGAFKDIVPGQIQHLKLPRLLEGFDGHAFEGLGPIHVLEAWSYDIDRAGDMLCESPISCHTLIVLDGLYGSFFCTDIVRDADLKRIIMPVETDIRFSAAHRLGEYMGFGFENVEELVLYVCSKGPGYDDKNIPLNQHLLRNTMMWVNLRKLAFINCFHYDEEREETTFWWRPAVVRGNRVSVDSVLPQTEEGWAACGFKGDATICDMQSLEELVLPYGLQRIEDGQFRNNPKLRRIVIPTSVKSIGRRAFEGCTNLKSIAIPEQALPHTQPSAFAGCPGLKSIRTTAWDHEVLMRRQVRSVLVRAWSAATVAEKAFDAAVRQIPELARHYEEQQQRDAYPVGDANGPWLGKLEAYRGALERVMDDWDAVGRALSEDEKTLVRDTAEIVGYTKRSLA